MIELLSIPAWNAPPVTLDDWIGAFSSQGLVVALEPDPPEGVWLEIASLRFRALVLTEDNHATAVHFELSGPDSSAARAVVEKAALALGWEIHDDTEDEDD
jgi:hypothetical protein